MISSACNKAEFIKAVQDKDYPQVIRLAEQEVFEAKRISYSGRGLRRTGSLSESLREETVKNKKWNNTEYVNFLKGFLFFMRGSGIKPSSVSDSDFQLFRPVCVSLVQKEQFKPEIMDFFEVG